jgi:CubicO group peptidase (beta-lactamase class C family)
MISPPKPLTRHLTLFILCILSVIFPLWLKAEASDPSVPWECSNYSGDAQTRCIQGMLEEQRNRIGQLEEQLLTQQSQLKALQNEAARPPQVTTPPAAPAPPPPVPYAYGYGYPYGYVYYPPGIGLGFSFGGLSGYGHRYWGPQYYGHWGHGHHR